MNDAVVFFDFAFGWDFCCFPGYFIEQNCAGIVFDFQKDDASWGKDQGVKLYEEIGVDFQGQIFDNDGAFWEGDFVENTVDNEFASVTGFCLVQFFADGLVLTTIVG